VLVLVLNSSEGWSVRRAQFSSFVCDIMFSGVYLTILQSQFISSGTLKIFEQFAETDIQ
jgi:hypothetical protein